MSKQDISIKHINLLDIRSQRGTLIDLLNLIDVGEISVATFNSENDFETARKNIESTKSILDEMIITAERHDFLNEHVSVINVNAENP